MVAAKIPSPTETRWFYEGADNQIYGPYPGQSMLEWVKSGYFKDNLLVKTNLEDNFHPLGEWTRVLGGKLPFFFSNLTTFENAVNAPSVGPPMNPMQPPFFFPPGLAPPTTFPPHFRHPNLAGFFSPEAAMSSHQAAESPLDGRVHGHAEIADPRPPSTRTIGTDPPVLSKKDIATQTGPHMIPKEQAIRILSELFGQKVQLS